MSTPTQPKRTADEAIAYNRQKKAERIYGALRLNGITLKHIQKFGEHQWSAVAADLKYKDGISASTRGIIRDMFDRQG